MANVNDQVTAFNRSQLEAALNLAEAAAEQMEKLAEVQFKAAKGAYSDGVKTLRRLAAMKDVNELTSATAELAEPALSKASAYVKNLYNVVASAQNQFAATLEQQVSGFNKGMLGTLDEAIKSAPAGSEAALAGVKASLQSTSAVYETMVKAAKQMASIAEANIVAISQPPPARK